MTGSGYGIDCREDSPAYLSMPASPAIDYSNVPSLLSQTGVFSDTANMVLATGLVAYDLIQPLWSDRSDKYRWLSLPTGTSITWSETGYWVYPAGSVLVKHFELPVDDNDPNITQRLEVRLLALQSNGIWYGVTYKWRSDNSDADLLTDSLSENITIQEVGEEQESKPGGIPVRMTACPAIMRVLRARLVPTQDS